MSSDEIKDTLATLYKDESFKRKLKVIDGMKYVHRAFSSKKRNVIVTAAEEDDLTVICSIVEVDVIPIAADLKEFSRKWLKNGPLQGLVFDISNNQGSICAIVSAKYLWEAERRINDQHCLETLLSPYGFCEVTESTFEIVPQQRPEAIEKLLIALGAERVFIEPANDPANFPKCFDINAFQLTDEGQLEETIGGSTTSSVYEVYCHTAKLVTYFASKEEWHAPNSRGYDVYDEQLSPKYLLACIHHGDDTITWHFCSMPANIAAERVDLSHDEWIQL